MEWRERERALKLRKWSKTHLWAQGELLNNLIVDLLVELCFVVV